MPRATVARALSITPLRLTAMAGLPPLVVVLDMDECLVHSTEFSASSRNLRQHEASRPGAADASGAVHSFPCRMADGTSFNVLKRTGVDAFLAECCSAFETYVFTAGTEGYASAVLDDLDPERRLAGRFYRHDCRPVRTPHGEQYLKDLSAVATRRGQADDNLARMVLVDNNPLSFVCNPQNGILVPDFVGGPDDVLPQVMKLLRELETSAADVRPILTAIFNLETRLKEVREEFLGANSSKL